MSTVHEKVVQITPDLVKKLKEEKILNEKNEYVELSEVQPGETPIGQLTVEEIEVFNTIHALDAQLMDMATDHGERDYKDLVAESLIRMGRALKGEITEEEREQSLQDAIKFDELRWQHDYLKTMFFYMLRKRFGAFGPHIRIGIRKKYVVCKYHSMPDA